MRRTIPLAACFTMLATVRRSLARSTKMTQVVVVDEIALVVQRTVHLWQPHTELRCLLCQLCANTVCTPMFPGNRTGMGMSQWKI